MGPIPPKYTKIFNLLVKNTLFLRFLCNSCGIPFPKKDHRCSPLAAYNDHRGNPGALENTRKNDSKKYSSVPPQAHRTSSRGTLPISLRTQASKARLNPRYSRGAALARRRRLRYFRLSGCVSTSTKSFSNGCLDALLHNIKAYKNSNKLS